MRIYDKQKPGYDYPDDMERILGYLHANGELRVSGTVVEKLYREFSEDVCCASWMSISDELLDDFADWLDRYKA